MIYADVYSDGRHANSLFANEDTVHRFNPTITPRLLRQAFLEHGIEINTFDLNVGRNVGFELHMDGRAVGERILPRYLIALENPNINKFNADSAYCQQFDLVFTWDKRLFQLPNVVPVLIPHPMEYEAFPDWSQRQIFSCLINANKAFKETLPSDLYVERLHTIRWYEKHAPDRFELYGMGWEKSVPAYTALGRLSRLSSRFKTKVFGIPAFPSYKGAISDKSAILKRARFSFCYENSRDLSNYITEKIFDSLVSGCVPIYWGADNVLDYIPADCFIDRRDFSSTSEVHQYLSTIDANRFAKYQENIFKYLQSDGAQQFSSKNFAHTVATNVVRHLSSMNSN